MTDRKEGFGVKTYPCESEDGQETSKGVCVWELLTQKVGVRHVTSIWT